MQCRHIFPSTRQHHTHLCHPLLKQQTGVGPFGAKFLLRIKLTHQNKLPVALEALRDWHLQRIQDAGPVPQNQGPQSEPEVLDLCPGSASKEQWTRVKYSFHCENKCVMSS